MDIQLKTPNLAKTRQNSGPRIRFLFLAMLLFSSLNQQLSAQCANNPGYGNTTGNVPFGTSNNWANPNFVDEDDQVYARVKLNTGETSKYLLVSDFQFTLPQNAVIQGISVEVQKKQDVLTDIQDASVRLTLNGNPIGDDKALPLIWTPNDAYTTYGGPLDTWGVNLTVNDIMKPDFGFLIAATRTGGFGVANSNFHAYIDEVRMTVWYDDGTNCLLPVTWGGITAHSENKGEVTLNWNTLSETNNQFFDIERSTDGQNFQSVGTVPSLSSGLSVTSYEWTDADAPEGQSFYRLRQTDIDGNQSHSPVIRAISLGDGELSLKAWPNPVQNELNINLNSRQLDGTLRLISPDGRTYWRTELRRADSFADRIDLSQLSPGIYFLSWNSLSGNEMLKIIRM